LKLAITLFTSVAALFAPVAPRALAEVRTEGDVLIFNGPINRESADAVEAELRGHPSLRRLRITSAGGQAPDGVRIGELVWYRSLDIEVISYCNSACAQYVFVAGKRKIVAPRAIVTFHGTPASIAAELAHSPFKYGAALFSDEIAKEQDFYRRMGIDISLLVGAVTYLHPFCTFIIPSYPATSRNHYAVFMAPQGYVLDYASMKRLGIGGIEGFWPTSQASLDSAVRSQPFKSEFVVKYVTDFDPLAITKKPAELILPDCTAL